MLRLRPTDIELGERQRALCSEAVDRLAQSMDDIGLRQPITVRIVDCMVIDGHQVEGVPVLVAGAHRLAAAKQLGWDSIDCAEIDGDHIEAELWEVSENLHRLDLTKEQRDQHIRRYAELLGQRRVSTQNAAKIISQPKRGRPKGVPREIAEKTGLSIDTVRRALKPRAAQESKPALDVCDVETAQFNALLSAWNRAGSEARRRFIDQIEGAL